MIKQQGQTIVEYIIIIGIVITVLYAMGPYFKRGVQSAVKMTADQIGRQEDADQDYTSDSQFMESARTLTNMSKQYTKRDTGTAVDLDLSQRVQTQANVVTNMGFQAQ